MRLTPEQKAVRRVKIELALRAQAKLGARVEKMNASGGLRVIADGPETTIRTSAVALTDSEREKQALIESIADMDVARASALQRDQERRANVEANAESLRGKSAEISSRTQALIAEERAAKAVRDAEAAESAQRLSAIRVAEREVATERRAADAERAQRAAERRAVAAEREQLAAAQQAAGTTIAQATASYRSKWEWQENDGEWKSYSDANSNVLSDAFWFHRMQGGPAVCSLSGSRYSVDFATWQQTRSGTGGSRAVRRLPSQFETAGGIVAASDGGSSLPPWASSTSVTQLSGGATLRSLAVASVGSLARESHEWNMAVGQFKRLNGSSGSYRVVSVDVYSCPAVAAAFQTKKQEFARRGAPTDEIWIFHGTMAKNVGPIMTGGFKVGGVDRGVAVAHGAAHGSGVYTAKGAGTPMGYTGGAKEVILARAMQGSVGAQGSSDCWEPQSDWAIFRDGKQLLLVYVLRFQ